MRRVSWCRAFRGMGFIYLGIFIDLYKSLRYLLGWSLSYHGVVFILGWFPPSYTIPLIIGLVTEARSLTAPTTLRDETRRELGHAGKLRHLTPLGPCSSTSSSTLHRSCLNISCSSTPRTLCRLSYAALLELKPKELLYHVVERL